MSTTTYLVQGMTCEHCTRAVAGGIESLAAVARADVDLDRGAVTVETTAPVADDDIAAAVVEAGYTYGGRV